VAQSAFPIALSGVRRAGERALAKRDVNSSLTGDLPSTTYASYLKYSRSLYAMIARVQASKREGPERKGRGESMTMATKARGVAQPD